MLYVLDTNSFIVLGHYFPERFPSFWLHLNELADSGRLTSVSEVAKELENHNTKEHLSAWIAGHKKLFPPPTADEMAFVATIFGVPAFQALVSHKKRLGGGPVADPFVIARAAAASGRVVTEETSKTPAIRIPTVCNHFKIGCTNLEGLMAGEGWQY